MNNPKDQKKTNKEGMSMKGEGSKMPAKSKTEKTGPAGKTTKKDTDTKC